MGKCRLVINLSVHTKLNEQSTTHAYIAIDFVTFMMKTSNYTMQMPNPA